MSNSSQRTFAWPARLNQVNPSKPSTVNPRLDSMKPTLRLPGTTLQVEDESKVFAPTMAALYGAIERMKPTGRRSSS
jgi:hypothetical protein